MARMFLQGLSTDQQTSGGGEWGKEGAGLTSAIYSDLTLLVEASLIVNRGLVPGSPQLCNVQLSSGV